MNLEQLNYEFARLQFKSDAKSRQNLWRKLGKLLRDGIPIIQGLQELRRLRKPNSPMAIAIDDWIRGMNNGRKLSEVVQPWVNAEEGMLILAGEQAGNLEGALDSVVRLAKASKAIRGAVISGLTYPTFLLLMAFGALYFFGYKIIPAFAQAAPQDSWHGLARTMINVAGFVQDWLHWIALAVVCLIAAFFASLPRWDGSLRITLDRYAPYSIYRVMQGSAWLIALSALTQAGMRIETAIEQLGRNSSTWARARCAAALKGLRAGRNLGDALERSGYEFPDREIISDIRLYATKSGFDEALRIIGDEWITESVERVQSMMKGVFSIALVMVGSVIMFIATGLGAMQFQLMEILQRTTQ